MGFNNSRRIGSNIFYINLLLTNFTAIPFKIIEAIYQISFIRKNGDRKIYRDPIYQQKKFLKNRWRKNQKWVLNLSRPNLFLLIFYLNC
jgi:hypothetical protein